MKTFLSALTGIGLFAFPAQAEFSFNTYGRATGLYGYTDAEKRFEDVESKQMPPEILKRDLKRDMILTMIMPSA